MTNSTNGQGIVTPLVRLRTPILVVLLFLAIWLPRLPALDRFVTADEADWLQRSVNFTQALILRDWAGTYQFVHPAETTLWAGSLGVVRAIPDLPALIQATPEQRLPSLDDWLPAATGITPLQLLAVTRTWVTVFISFATVLAFFPLRRLFGSGMAFVALLMVAWSPMMVGFSRELQPDGFLATFYFLAVSGLLAWLYAGLQARYLLLSGVAMGLAWLTKTPAALLVPAGGLVVGLELVRHVRTRRSFAYQSDDALDHVHEERYTRTVITGFVLWGVIAVLVFVALFPALWVDPVAVLRDMYTVMLVYSEGHTNPNFFMGRIVDDPGPFFYPVAYLFRATPAALIGLLWALIAGLRRVHPFASTDARRAAAGMLVFSLLFVLAMSVIGKKFDRYLLPVFPLVLTLSAGGWLALARGLAGRVAGGTETSTPRRSKVQVAVAVLTIVVALIPLHGWLTARHYPYYITYYNPLAGGNRAAVRTLFYGWGEGLEEASAWLNEQPNAANASVITWYADGSVSYIFQGHAVGVEYGSRINWLDADYLILYVNQVQRNIPTEAAVAYFLRQTPAHEVIIDGIVMARVYDLRAILDDLAEQAPALEESPVEVTWPDLSLSHFETLATASISSALPVELRFTGVVDATRKVSLRLFSEREVLVAQLDVPLAPEVEVDLFVPPDAVPGGYELRMMVYDEESLEPALTVDGEDLVVLNHLLITAR